MEMFKRLLGFSLIIGIFVSCTSKGTKIEHADESANVVEITAKNFKFEAPDSIQSGWNTIRFTNKGAQEHFVYIYRLPDNKTFDDLMKEAVDPLNSVWAEYASGKITREEAIAKLGTEMAPWYFTDVVPSGGPALTEPGEASQVTVKLEPGLYTIECYVKMPDGTWHTEMGMQQALTVTGEKSSVMPPEADVDLTLTNYEIATKGELTTGVQTIAVHVKENPQGFMMHDINLFRLNDTTQVEEIVAWMDWMDLDQFKAPAPGYSLGGMEHLAAGKTGYMKVDLKPGNYAWVSEGYGSKGMFKTFTVKEMASVE